MMFAWMAADSQGRWLLPLIFLPIDLVLVFVGVFAGLRLERRFGKRARC